MLGMATLPSFLQRAVAATSGPSKKKMVVLFQRGAMDGLNVVVPFAEPNYYQMRPTIAIPQPQRGGAEAAIDLDGFFALHPSLQPLQPLFQQGNLAIIQAVGSPDPTRSHFDAQDFMRVGHSRRKVHRRWLAPIERFKFALKTSNRRFEPSRSAHIFRARSKAASPPSPFRISSNSK